MKWNWRFSLFSITLLLIYSSELSLISAQEFPTRTIDWSCRDYPAEGIYAAAGSTMATDNWEEDCSLFPEDQPIWQTWLENSDPICFDNPVLAAELVGNADYQDRLNPFGNGSADIQIVKIPNFAIDPQNLSAHPELFAYEGVSYAGNARNDRYLAECQEQGLSLEACHQHLTDSTLNLNGSLIKNSYMTSTEYQRSFNLKQQFQDKSIRAEEIVACTSTNPPPGDRVCDNLVNYNGTNSLSKAKELLTYTWETFSLLSRTPEGVEKQNDLLNLPPTKAAGTFYIVILPQVTMTSVNNTSGASIFTFINNLFNITFTDHKRAYVFRFSVPGAHLVANNLKLMVGKNYSKTTGNQLISDIPKSMTKTITKGDGGELPIPQDVVTSTTGPLRLLLQRINQFNPACSTAQTPKQFTGALSPARASEESGLSILWNFLFTGSPEDADDHDMEVYKSYLIQDGAIAYAKEGANLTERLLYNLSYSASFNSDVDIPFPINSERPNASTDPAKWTEQTVVPCQAGETPDADGLCRRIDDEGTVFVSYTGSTTDDPTVSGGELADRKMLQGDHRILKSIQDPQRMDSDECFDRQADSMAQSVGRPLLEWLGVNQNPEFDLSACGSALSSTTTANYSADYSCPISVEQMRQSGMGILPNPPPLPPSDYLQFYNWIANSSGFPSNTHTNTNDLPDPVSVGCMINYAEAFWTGSKFTPENINQVVAWAQSHGWSPSLLLSFWLEESHAGQTSTKEFGCGAEGINPAGYDAQLACLETVNLNLPYARFLCAFAGDCPENETQDTNPNFPAFIQFYNIFTTQGVW